MNSISPAASLDDPFYYLANFRFVLGWVSERHGDLLDAAERGFLTGFAALPKASQALLVRMVMRKGEHFRVSRLVYAEIGDSEAALAPLVAAGFVEANPELLLDTLFAQLRLAELRHALAGRIAEEGLPASLGKAALFEALASRPADPRPLAAWWPGARDRDRVVRLAVMEICDRLRLMFFGNLRQGWEEFVLTGLGLQRFEVIPLTPQSRAFQRREELEVYLALQRLRERLEAGEAAVALASALPAVPDDNGWLLARRQRLEVALGRQAEREGEPALACRLYASAGWPVAAGSAEARIRRLRLLERLGGHGEAHALIRARLAADPAPAEAESQALARLLPRLGRRLGLPAEASASAPAPPGIELTLPRRVGVELAVCDHLWRDDAPVHYVENALFAGLFGLLCWEALFAPLPGAFFHPFQAAPADLGREDFVARRRERFDACLARLGDGSHREAILATWRTKHGIASPFVHWEALDEALLTRALSCIPPEHLRACCERLLVDPLVNRAGLPDLIQFLPEAPADEPRYRLIEVKGPGDRLQDNQRRWLAFFQARGIPATVCRVRWRDEPA